MNVKIYQAYYDPIQLPSLDSAFIPYDNTENKRPDLREYPLLKDLFQKNRHTDAHWGLVSWKWKEKTHLEPQVFRQWILDNPGYDVYHFDAYLIVAALCNNLWCQDGYTDFANVLFPKIGINVPCQDISYKAEDFATCNFVIGNSHFWTEFFLYVDNILVLCSQDEYLYEQLYRRGRMCSSFKDGKEHFSVIPNFIFIIERLVSLFFIQNRNIKVKKFPIEHECYTEMYGKHNHDKFIGLYNMKKEGTL